MIQSPFEEQVAAVWAAHFDCPPLELDRPGSTLLPRPRLATSGWIHISHIRSRAFVELDPSLHEEFAEALIRQGRQHPLTAELLKEIIPQPRLVSSDSGMIFHLEPDRLVDYPPDRAIKRRVLCQTDVEALSQLLEACDPAEVEDAFIEVDHELAACCLDGSRMVSAGSGYRRNGFMDIGVITHPAYRGRHLAPAVVAAISQDAAALDVIAQYRCDATNTASRRVAELCGFTKFFQTESIRVGPL